MSKFEVSTVPADGLVSSVSATCADEVDNLEQDYSISIATALEILQSYTKLSKWGLS